MEIHGDFYKKNVFVLCLETGSSRQQHLKLALSSFPLVLEFQTIVKYHVGTKS